MLIMRNVETVGAFAVSSVHERAGCWQGFAVDLRGRRDAIASAVAHIGLSAVPAGATLCLGYAGEQVLQTVRIPRMGRAKHRRVELSSAAVAALNASRGGAFYFDAWFEGVHASGELMGFRLALCTAADERAAA
jgi:hypothetical protein